MRKADDDDLRAALSEEVENLAPSDELWNTIYERSVAPQEKRRNLWLQGAVLMGTAAAAAAIFVLAGPLMKQGPGPEPPAGNGPVTLVAPGEPTTLPAPADRTLTAPAPTAGRISVRYNHTMYWYNGESIRTEELGALLAVTTRERGDTKAPEPDGYSNVLEAGREVRAIKGSDPVRRIAVQADQGWYVFDNMLKPIAPSNP